MADLPIERLAYKKPAFTNTCLDCFGPLQVTIRRTTEKRWILLFTCLTTRAIHLEVIHSLNTSSSMMAIDRFVARRGRSNIFWSDNGTNFVSASKDVNTIETPVLQEKCAQRCIKWKFKNTPEPNQGWAWESLIKSCKRILSKILKSSKVKEEVFSTSLCLVEQAMKTRHPASLISLLSFYNDKERPLKQKEWFSNYLLQPQKQVFKKDFVEIASFSIIFLHVNKVPGPLRNGWYISLYDVESDFQNSHEWKLITMPLVMETSDLKLKTAEQ